MKLASFLLSLFIHIIIIGLLFLLFKSVPTHTMPTYTVSLLTPGEGRAGHQHTIQPLTTSPKPIPHAATTLPPKINKEIQKAQEQIPPKPQNIEEHKKVIEKPQTELKKVEKEVPKPKVNQKEIQENIQNKIQQLKAKALQEKITQLKEAMLENKIREIAQQLRENSQTQSGVGNIKAQGSGVGNQDKLFSDYLSVVQGIIHSNWFVDQNLLPNNRLVTRVKITIAPDGKIISVNIIKSSGNPYYDRTVITAINNSTLPPVPQKYLNNRNTLDLVLNFFIKD
ncbi:cell envelope integrity protein TolA [Desulfurella sp.]|uniref:cell envelope integrity protein TolA n=1 Tax=Desulfurella sp. TaxID=1962857 RepID=UPI0025BA7819|nr:cell envelope integrity protein TolA [Desulfurella sp.]